MFLAPILLILFELTWQILIKYPPTLEQLNLGIGSASGLWAVRIASLILILISTFLFSRNIKGKVKNYFWIILLTSPTVSFIWMANPLTCLKIFIIALVFYLLSKKYKSHLFIVAAGIVAVLVLNLFIFKEKPEVLHLISPTATQTEVITRIMIEGDFTNRIKIPNLVRRIGYNKYFITLRNFSNESLKFFDFETLFFQEVHPLGQKSFVMFYWPEAYLFIIGIWYFSGKKSENQKWILSLFLLSFIYFLTTAATTELRLALTLWPVTAVIAEGIESSLKSKSKILKAGVIFLIFATIYGYATNYYDRSVRPLFYLDNRPPAYEFIFNNLKDQDLTKYSQIVFPNTLYSAKFYCKYYLKDCGNIVFSDFDLFENAPAKNTLYVGFIGNFLGPNPDNTFPSSYDGFFNGKGLEILDKTHVNDNIANQYGQDLFIANTK